MKVLQPEDKHAKRASKPEPVVIWTLLTALGLTVAVIGWADLSLIWIPPDFGNPSWEFGAIATNFEALPLGTVGLALLSVGLLGRGNYKAVRIVAALFALIAVALLGAYVIYLLDVPLALRGVQDELRSALKKGIAKTTLAAITYSTFYAWAAWYMLRSTRVR